VTLCCVGGTRETSVIFVTAVLAARTVLTHACCGIEDRLPLAILATGLSLIVDNLLRARTTCALNRAIHSAVLAVSGARLAQACIVPSASRACLALIGREIVDQLRGALWLALLHYGVQGRIP